MTALQQDNDLEERLDAALDTIKAGNPAMHQSLIAALDAAANEEREADYEAIARRVIAYAADVQAKVNVAKPAAPSVQKKARGVQDKAAPVQERAPDVQGDIKRALGVAALVFGICLWTPGAHYQLDGWTHIFNTLLSMVRSGIELPLAEGWWALLLIPCGIIYSIGERRYLPFAKAGRAWWQWHFLGGAVLLVWVLVNGSDLLSAYTGIVNPAEEAGEWAKWAAQTRWAALAWMLVVVYIGDMLIVLGWRWTGMKQLWERQQRKSR